ncbi:RloB family protein [Candidatus Symbiothrix dinenymphae]|uniref:RloB family protein n=1 Tax=Candidatus Symbiothrix dinenymphae TaxID=467085 RepID=UPI0006C4123B|nr:RloB family protein [Candidatus Symbiothrix dinenymphae]GAP72698.1 hypothetical protein SAMD00024442_4_49 [Candidatus Symbiothrix dinenymphae]
MARVIKIDNALQKKFAYKSNKKKASRDVRVFFLIVCEGEKTEPNYFKSFPKQIGNIVLDVKCDGGGISTLKVVEKAIKLRDKSVQKYDRVWAVFDKDNFKPNAFNSAILKAKTHNIGCAWSNEAFELWYLLHFHNRVTAMSRDEYKKAIEQEVNKKWKSKKKPYKYLKEATDTYAILQKYGDQTQAIANAEKLSNSYDDEKFAEHNPCTYVFKLVEELIGKSDELNEEIKNKFNKGE